MSEYIITKRVECTICCGKGHIEHSDGDIEPCTYCLRRGHFDLEATVDDVLRDCGAQPQPVSDAANALETMRYVVNAERSNERIGAFAFVAIAEQLAAMNAHLETLVEFASYKV